MAGYNLTREVEQLLDRIEPSPPSFTVHLHPEYWTLNSGSKLPYNNQVASLLDDIRAHRIPVDFLELFDAAGLPFYDGCLVVELLDYRPQRGKEQGKPERTRVVLHPNPETLWADICLLNQKSEHKWSDRETLEVEARLLLATAPPLCLDPDPHLTRIANHVLRVSTPTVPVSLKRKAAVIDPEEDESDKARRIKIAQFMNPRANRSGVPNYRILDAIQRTKALREARPPPQLVPGVGATSMPPPMPPQPAPPIQQPLSSQSSPAPNIAPETPPVQDDAKKMPKPIIKKNPESAPSPYTRPETQASTPTPVPQQPTANQYQAPHPASHSSPPAAAHSPIPPHVYNNVQAATDVTKRVSSPAQLHNFTQSPKPPQLPPVQSSPHPQHLQTQQPQPQPPYLPAVSQMHYAQTVQMPRNVQAKTTPNNGAKQPNGSLSNNPSQFNQQAYIQAWFGTQQQHQQHQAQSQQQQHQQQPQPQPQPPQQARMVPAQQHAGRSTPQAPQLTRSPMLPPNAQQRNSPLVTNQPLTSRSPMPPNSQQISQMTHPQQYFNLASAAQHIRMVPGNSSSLSHPQAALPSHMSNGGVQAPSLQPQPGHQVAQPQDQTHAQAMMSPYQMYGYPMGMNYGVQSGRLHAGYGWPPMGMGRGIPGVVNGQPVPGMTSNAQHPQTMPVGVGKTVPGGMPNR